MYLISVLLLGILTSALAAPLLPRDPFTPPSTLSTPLPAGISNEAAIQQQVEAAVAAALAAFKLGGSFGLSSEAAGSPLTGLGSATDALDGLPIVKRDSSPFPHNHEKQHELEEKQGKGGLVSRLVRGLGLKKRQGALGPATGLLGGLTGVGGLVSSLPIGTLTGLLGQLSGPLTSGITSGLPIKE